MVLEEPPIPRTCMGPRPLVMFTRERQETSRPGGERRERKGMKGGRGQEALGGQDKQYSTAAHQNAWSFHVECFPVDCLGAAMVRRIDSDGRHSSHTNLPYNGSKIKIMIAQSDTLSVMRCLIRKCRSHIQGESFLERFG